MLRKLETKDEFTFNSEQYTGILSKVEMLKISKETEEYFKTNCPCTGRKGIETGEA